MLTKQRKNLFRAVSIAILAAIFIVATPASIFAQATAPAASVTAGSALAMLAKETFGVAGLGVVAALILVARGISAMLLGWSAMLLDLTLTWNFTVVPADIQAVQIGWAIFRDMANGLFILIILWIALTIVLNIENLGGRKMLFRVITSAALINFSLLLVTLVFGFTNMLAEPFIKALPHDSSGNLAVGTHIANLFSVQNTFKAVGDEDQQLANRAAQASVGGQQTYKPGIKNTLLASVGIKQAQAQFGLPVGVAAGCLLALWAGGPIGCIGGGIIGGILGTLGEFALFGSPFSRLLSYTTVEGMGLLYILLATTAFTLAAIALLVRIIAMIFLSIFAPLVFLIYALPFKAGKQYLEMWLKHLGNDAFFAPMFFILFYLALTIMERGSTAFYGTSTNPAINPDAITLNVISMVFILASIFLAKKAGGVVTETTISLGKGALGLAAMGAAAAATGGTSLALTSTRAGAALESGIGKLESSRFGAITRPLTARARGALGAPSERIEKDAKKYQKLAETSPSTLKGMRNAAGLSPERQAAMDLAAARAGKFDTVVDDPAKQRAALQRLQRLNLHKDVLEKNPHLITNENAASLVSGIDENTADRVGAKRAAVRKLLREKEVDPSELSRLSQEDPDVQREILLNLEGNTLTRIARKNAEAYRALMSRFADEAEREGGALAGELTAMNAQMPGHERRIRDIVTNYRRGHWGSVRDRRDERGGRGGRGGREEGEGEEGEEEGRTIPIAGGSDATIVIPGGGRPAATPEDISAKERLAKAREEAAEERHRRGEI